MHPSTYHPSKQQILRSLLLTYLAWFYANLAANGLFGLSFARSPDLRIYGDIVYYLGIAVSGVAVPMFLIRRWRLKIQWFPVQASVFYWLISAALIFLAIMVGGAAMQDAGMSFSDLLKKPFVYLFGPIPIFLPTMIAYSLLWHVLFLQGFRSVFGSRTRDVIKAVVCTAGLYALYHLASIDEITTAPAMMSEIAITFTIRCVLLAFVIGTRSLGPAFIADWLINYFVFSPMTHFHPEPWKWPIGILILMTVWFVSQQWTLRPASTNTLSPDKHLQRCK